MPESPINERVRVADKCPPTMSGYHAAGRTGEILREAYQEPAKDQMPLLYYWIVLDSDPDKGRTLLINVDWLIFLRETP